MSILVIIQIACWVAIVSAVLVPVLVATLFFSKPESDTNA